MSIPRFSRQQLRALRASLNMSQRQFAEAYGFTATSIQHWEEGRPIGKHALLLLRIIRDHPQAARLPQPQDKDVIINFDSKRDRASAIFRGSEGERSERLNEKRT